MTDESITHFNHLLTTSKKLQKKVEENRTIFPYEYLHGASSMEVEIELLAPIYMVQDKGVEPLQNLGS